MSKKHKIIPIDNIALITNVTYPDGSLVRIIDVDDFMRYEADDLEKDYCCIIGNNCMLGSKRKFDTACVNGYSKEMMKSNAMLKAIHKMQKINQKNKK